MNGQRSSSFLVARLWVTFAFIAAMFVATLASASARTYPASATRDCEDNSVLVLFTPGEGVDWTLTNESSNDSLSGGANPTMGGFVIDTGGRVFDRLVLRVVYSGEPVRFTAYLGTCGVEVPLVPIGDNGTGGGDTDNGNGGGDTDNGNGGGDTDNGNGGGDTDNGNGGGDTDNGNGSSSTQSNESGTQAVNALPVTGSGSGSGASLLVAEMLLASGALIAFALRFVSRKSA